MADRANPATSAGWQVTQRLPPVGAVASCCTEVEASCSAMVVVADCPGVVRALLRKTRRTTMSHVETCEVAVVRRDRHIPGGNDPVPEIPSRNMR